MQRRSAEFSTSEGSILVVFRENVLLVSQLLCLTNRTLCTFSTSGSPPARVAPDCDHHSERVPIFAHPSPPGEYPHLSCRDSNLRRRPKRSNAQSGIPHSRRTVAPEGEFPQETPGLLRGGIYPGLVFDILTKCAQENNNSEIPNYSKREQRNPALVQTSSFPTEVVDSELDCMSKDDPLINGALRSRVKDMPEDMVCDKDKYDTPIVTARPKIPSKSPAMLSSPDSSGNDAMPLSNAYSQSLPHQRSDKVMKINNRIYKRLELIGRGGSSKVFKIISQDGRKFLALKRVSLRGADSAAIKGYLSEIDFLKRLRKNSRIITLIDYQVSLSDGLIHMVLEYGEIDLARLCHKYRNSPMSLNSIRMYWEQMLNAVHTIHQENIIHSDLKPANFLLVEGALKLIDFGIARSIPNDTTNVHRDYQTGTINYMAPEAISFIEKNSSSSDRKSYIKLGRASDVWSLGCILYQMVYGQPPFAYLDTIIKKLQCIVDPNYQIAFPQSILVETPPPSSSQDAKGAAGASNISNKVTIRVDPSIISAIKGCLVRVPQDRMSIPQLLEHELLVPKTSTPPSEERPSSSTLAETLSKDTKLLNVIAREIIVTSVERLQANVFPSALLAMSDDIARVISSQLENGERVDLGKFRNTTYTPP